MRAALLLLSFSTLLFSQTEVGPRTFKGSQDMSAASWKPPAVTVSGLPTASANSGRVYLVTDSSTAGDCTTGGGSARTFCVSNGTSWVALGDGTGGGGGSGDITAVGNCATGDCFQSQTANTIFAAPNGSAGQASFRALVFADLPVINIPWQVGVGFESTPSTGDVPVPLQVPANCSGTITMNKVNVTARNRGTGNMSFNVLKCTNGTTETCVSVFSGGAQTYSSTGNIQQSFTPDQNNTPALTDYFKINLSAVNGQDDFAIVLGGKCAASQ